MNKMVTIFTYFIISVSIIIGRCLLSRQAEALSCEIDAKMNYRRSHGYCVGAARIFAPTWPTLKVLFFQFESAFPSG